MNIRTGASSYKRKFMTHFRLSSLLKAVVAVAIAVVLAYSCATPVAPTGGAKDEIPPVVVASEPANYTTNFNSERITITFDEFIQLQGVTNKLMISPPMEQQPEIKTRGKSVVIDIIDTLAANTTYSFYFADAIADLHESNPINNFRFVFSTGPELDSMQISGRIADAYNLKPVKDALIMLYKTHNDSAPLQKIPFYISKSDESGHFRLSNLSRTRYKLFALKDANSNYLFDMPNERIAFSDTLIMPTEVTKRETFTTPDTASADTTAGGTADSLSMTSDTTTTHAYDHANDSVILRFFKERDTLLRLTTTKLNKNRYLTFAFNKKIDSLTLTPLKPDMPEDWHMKEWFKAHDSLRVWLKDFTNDSLVLKVQADADYHDTLTYTYFADEKKEPAEGLVPEAVELDGNIQLLKHPLQITFNSPVLNTSQVDSLMLYSSTDTTKTAFRKTGLRNLTIDHPWREAENYKVYFPDSAFTSIYGKGNDSTVVSFRTRTLKDYGTLTLNVTADTLHGESHYLLQLLSKDEKEELRTISVQHDTTLKMNLLKPGQYKLKGILDENNNKRWDSGIYLRKEQPEKVFYYQGTIEVIGNWEVELEWKIEP